MSLRNFPALLVLQSVACVIWTYIATVPVWLIVTRGLGAMVSALGLTLVLTFVGLLRYETFGEVRRREFGTIPYLFRSIVLAAPAHVLHGAALSFFVVSWMKFDRTALVGDEDEVDEQLRRAFFQYFLHGWLFSSLFLFGKRQKLSFGRLSPTTRLQALIAHAPRSGLNLLAMNMVGIMMGAWSGLWLCVSFSLEFNDAVLGAILSEKTRKGDLEDDEVAPAMAKMATGSVEEVFQSFPILALNDAWDVPFPALLNKLPVQQSKDSLKEWWLSKRKLYKVEGEATGVNASTFLIQVSNDRFDSVMQMVYRCDAVDEGSAFAKSAGSLGFTREALRIRAYGLIAYTDLTLGVDKWIQALNACLSVLDAQTFRMVAFTRYAASKVEPPRNPITKLEDTDAFVPVGKSLMRDMSETEVEDRRRAARDVQWNVDHKQLMGRSYWKRVLWANIFWDFDPIYEESMRRLVANPDPIECALKRDIAVALVADFHLLCRASECAVGLAKKKRPIAVNSAEIISLVRKTLERCVRAGDEAMHVLDKAKVSTDNLYALLFCLDRDLQDLSS